MLNNKSTYIRVNPAVNKKRSTLVIHLTWEIMEKYNEIIDSLMATRKEQKEEKYTNQFKDTIQHNRYKKLIDKLIKLRGKYERH